jgi:hypothetical protein
MNVPGVALGELAGAAHRASQVIGLGLSLVLGRSLFGKPRPTLRQIGFCYGFSEALAEHSGIVAPVDKSVVILQVFVNLFAKHGGELFKRLITSLPSYEPSIEHGRGILRKLDAGMARLHCHPPIDDLGINVSGGLRRLQPGCWGLASKIRDRDVSESERSIEIRDCPSRPFQCLHECRVHT